MILINYENSVLHKIRFEIFYSEIETSNKTSTFYLKYKAFELGPKFHFKVHVLNYSFYRSWTNQCSAVFYSFL